MLCTVQCVTVLIGLITVTQVRCFGGGNYNKEDLNHKHDSHHHKRPTPSKGGSFSDGVIFDKE